MGRRWLLLVALPLLLPYQTPGDAGARGARAVPGTVLHAAGELSLARERDDLPSISKGRPAASDEFVACMAQAAGNSPDFGYAVAPSGDRAIVYVSGDATSETRAWYVTPEDTTRLAVTLPPHERLKGVWSGDCRRAVIGGNGGAWRPFEFAHITVAKDGSVSVGHGAGPAQARSWHVLELSHDGDELYIGTDGPRVRGELWRVPIPDGVARRIHQQPELRWPPDVQERIDKEGPQAEPMIGRGGIQQVLPSPSGRFLLFHAYPPDDYLSDALWLVDVSGSESFMITWETWDVPGRYRHDPKAWVGDDSTVLFTRDRRGEDGADELYVLELDAEILAPQH